MYLLLSGKRL